MLLRFVFGFFLIFVDEILFRFLIDSQWIHGVFIYILSQVRTFLILIMIDFLGVDKELSIKLKMPTTQRNPTRDMGERWITSDTE